MKQWLAYGLAIQSEIDLPELPYLDHDISPDVTVRLARRQEQPPVIDHTARTDSYLLETEAGKFVITSARTIVIYPLPGIAEGTVRTILLGQVLAAVQRLRGLLVLHASAVATDGGVVAFLANSGWGKSTLADALYIKGYPFVTDDVLVINTAVDSPVVLPGFPQVKLHAGASTSLGHTDLPRLSPDIDKLSHRLERRFVREPLPLKKLYILGGDSPDHKIVPLSPRMALINLIKNSHAASIPNRPDLNKLHFNHCTALVNAMPISLLLRKYSLEALPELVTLLEIDFVQS
jgi:hypothetical protein